MVFKLHTAVGQVLTNLNLVFVEPTEPEKSQIILQPNEALLMQTILANAATTHFIISCTWEEYT